MTDTAAEPEVEQDEPVREQKTYFPPAEVLVNYLRSEISSLNDRYVLALAQINFQADIITGLTEQIQAASEPHAHDDEEPHSH